MSESCDDIQEYLKIIEGKFPVSDKPIDTSVDFGVSTAGASIGDVYTYDNGLRWARLVEDEQSHWCIEHGFLEHEADSTEYISKHDMTNMIRSGEMTLLEETVLDGSLLEESFNLEDDGFDDFMDKVERYLLVNEGRESFDFEYDWEHAWTEGKSPLESAEEAILMEN